MKKVSVGFMRQVLAQYDKEEITFSRMTELINEEMKSEREAIDFLSKLRQGGKIVSSGSLSAEAISLAQANKNFLIDEDHFGYAYIPKAEPQGNVFKRDECIFQYCPHPDLCKDNCQNNRHGK